MYRGQVIEIRNKMNKSKIESVTVQTVDNYQGDENDIILLSLVRNNDKGEIGFLKTKNRIIVSLSRAKHALYIFGNVKILRHQDHWRDILQLLGTEKRIGNIMELIKN